MFRSLYPYRFRSARSGRQWIALALLAFGLSVGFGTLSQRAIAETSDPLPFEPIPIEPIEPLPIEPFPVEIRPVEIDATAIAPIYHIVLVDLLDTTTEAEIDALIADGIASISTIPGVLAVDIGRKIRDDREVHIADYDLGVYVLLDSIDALDVYGPHPNHQAFLARQRHLFSSIRVIDFVGNMIDSAPDSTSQMQPAPLTQP